MRTRRGVRAVLLVTALASAAWLAGPAQAAPAPHRSRLAGSPAGVVVLVRQWTWDQAAAAAVGRGGAVSAGLISTLPADASLADRVLSLAAGRPVDASALEGAVGASGSDGGEAAADRMRRANPDATFGQLPPTRVLAGPGMAAAGLLGIGGAGAPPTADPLPETGPLVSVSGELLVIAVPDAAAADRVLDRVQAPGGARARVLVVGLESPPGRARMAPLLALGDPLGPPGVATSDSTRRAGLVAFQDVRPTLTGSTEGTQGSPIHSLPRADPLAFVGHLDRQVGALVSARTLAVVLYAVLGTVALAACLVALLTARRPGWVGAVAGPAGHLGRALVLVSLAIPSGYLIASVVAPTAWVAWLVLGLAAAGVLTFAAWRLARPGGARGWAAPALLGALLTGLAVVDGLPGLGADVGGALTAMLSAAAALLLLGRARPSPTRVLWLSVAAVVAAAGIVVGVALLLGETTHGSRAAQDLGSDPGAALRAVGHQLGGNFGLLATNFWAWWGPLLVAFAGLSSVRPPALLAGVPEWVRRVVGVGAIGSALLILLNDTGVTAAAGSGLALVMTLAWSALEPTPYLRTPRSVRR